MLLSVHGSGVLPVLIFGRAENLDETEQLAAVGCRLHPRREHAIIRRTLGFQAEPSCGKPGERMKPKERAHRPTQQEPRPILSNNVRQLVQKDNSQAAL